MSIQWHRGSLSPESWRALVEADVILGHDTSHDREFTIFGTPPLESTSSFKRPSAMHVVQVAIDCENGELEELLTWVRSIKGREDLAVPGQ